MDRMSKSLLGTTVTAMLLVTVTVLPAISHAEGYAANRVVIYFTRHAEKMTVIDEDPPESGMYMDNCNDDRSRCEEALNPLGEKRAELLAKWFKQRRIAQKITHLFSSDKQRTRQTLEPLAAIVSKYDILPDSDGMDDGIEQLPFAGDKANEITSNSPSVEPTVAALQALPLGSVAVVAGHSGTLYRIFGGEDTNGVDDMKEGAGLGIDTTMDPFSFPKNDEGKVKDFGDVWKIVIRRNGNASFRWRKSLQFKALRVKY